MATIHDGEDTPTPPPLTRADILAVVRAVVEALKDQLKEVRPPVPTTNAGHRDPADLGEGTAPRPGKLLLLRLAPFSAAKLGRVLLSALHVKRMQLPLIAAASIACAIVQSTSARAYTGLL